VEEKGEEERKEDRSILHNFFVGWDVLKGEKEGGTTRRVLPTHFCIGKRGGGRTTFIHSERVGAWGEKKGKMKFDKVPSPP